MEIQREALIRAAIEQQAAAYAPYSDFFVSAAIFGEDGRIYTGVNVENASYPVGTCAERNALFHAVACGVRGFRAIAIVGGKHGEHQHYCAPCGFCRQALREFCDPKEMTVLLAKSVTDFQEYTLEDLLPRSFGPEDLKND